MFTNPFISCPKKTSKFLDPFEEGFVIFPLRLSKL